jgi:DNA-binding response OmpR family regulator
VDRNTIVAAVWPNDEPAGVSEEAIDGLIKRLRARLRETQPTSDYLRVIRGRGVRLVNND